MRKRDFHSHGIKDATALDSPWEIVGKISDELATAYRKSAIKDMEKFLKGCGRLERNAMYAILRHVTGHGEGFESIPADDREAINAYLNLGYAKYGLCVTLKDEIEYRCRRSYMLLLKLGNILDSEQTWRAVDANLGTALCDDDIDDFVMHRKAMVGLQQKEMNSHAKSAEERQSSNGREGAETDGHQKPHAPHAHGPSKTASNFAQDAASHSTSDFAPDYASESHENVQDEGMTGSKKKDAQKREYSTLQSLLSMHGREDSPKTSVNGQTSQTPLPDKYEPTSPHPDCKICPLYRDELAAFISWAQNRIREERKRLADDAAGKGKIDRLIFNFLIDGRIEK